MPLGELHERVQSAAHLAFPAGSLYTPDTHRRWVRAERVAARGALSGPSSVWLPLEAAASDPGELPEGYDALYPSVSNGLGAGFGTEQALTHALLELASPRAQAEGVAVVKAVVPGLEVETVSYGRRIDERNLRRLLAHDSPLVGLGAPLTGAEAIRLTAAAEARVGGPAWLHLVGTAYRTALRALPRALAAHGRCAHRDLSLEGIPMYLGLESLTQPAAFRSDAVGMQLAESRTSPRQVSRPYAQPFSTRFAPLRRNAVPSTLHSGTWFAARPGPRAAALSARRGGRTATAAAQTLRGVAR